MPLKAIVKVSHISNLSDARYCSGMGVEMLGFRVIPGDARYMAPIVFQDIRGWIAGPKIVAELYGVSTLQQIEEVIQTYSPDYLELSRDEYRAFGHKLYLPCIVYLSKGEEAASVEPKANIRYLLVDEHISCPEIVAASVPVMVRTGSVEKLRLKETEGCFKGYVVEGPGEIRPGITNYETLGAILEALEEDN